MAWTALSSSPTGSGAWAGPGTAGRWRPSARTSSPPAPWASTWAATGSRRSSPPGPSPACTASSSPTTCGFHRAERLRLRRRRRGPGHGGGRRLDDVLRRRCWAAASRRWCRRSSARPGWEAGWIRPFLASVLLLVVILFLPGGLASLPPAAHPHAGVGWDDDGGAAGAPRGAPLPRRRRDRRRPRGSSKEYGGVHAVRDIDLEVLGGEVVGLIGPNGAGKTTLVNMISGPVPPSSGRGDGPRRPGRPHPRAQGGGRGREPHIPALQAVQPALRAGERAGRRAPGQLPTSLRRRCGCPRPAATSRRPSSRPPGACAGSDWPTRPGNRASAPPLRRPAPAGRGRWRRTLLLILDEPAAGMNHVEAAKLSTLITSWPRTA